MEAATCFLFVFFIAIFATLHIVPAFGHAIPSTFSIEPNSILEKGSLPTKIVMTFSERPDPNISYIHVLNSRNERIDNNDFTITGSNGKEATVTLDTNKLAGEAGVYSVSWRSMSLDDGHIAEGGYVFGIGNVMPANVASSKQTQAQEITYVTSGVDALLKWPLIVSQVAIVGGVIAYFILIRNIPNSSRHHIAVMLNLNLPIKRFVLILVAGAIAIAICGTALVFLQSSKLDTDGNEQFLSTVGTLIFNSPTGIVWFMRIATSVIIATLSLVYLLLSKKASSQRRISSSITLLSILAAGSASIFSNSMLSHNSAVSFLPSVAVFADWLHFMAVSAWIGGLFFFSAVLMFAIIHEPSRRGAYILSLILPRFSLLAITSLGIIGVTGLYMAWLQLHSLDSLFYTQYGINLIIKLSAALPMVLLGVYHQTTVHKKIVLLATIGSARGTSVSPSATTNNNGSINGAVSKFGKTVKIESLIGIGVLFAASLLTITSPPSQMHDDEEHAVTMPGAITGGNLASAFSQEVTINNVNTQLKITPFQTGFNTFTVTLLDADGSSPQNINAVYLRFTNSEARIGPIVATLNKTSSESGNFSAVGGYLNQMGNWTIDLIVQRVGAYDLNHSFEANLGASTNGNRMNTDMNMQMSGEANKTNPSMFSSSNSSTGQMDSEMPSTFDSFAWLAISLS
ncbi:MAG TPA: CopD family protein, partial [Nitrososphaera sp.]